jgi:hypothetical protein
MTRPISKEIAHHKQPGPVLHKDERTKDTDGLRQHRIDCPKNGHHQQNCSNQEEGCHQSFQDIGKDKKGPDDPRIFEPPMRDLE